jgi:hypothetical protein
MVVFNPGVNHGHSPCGRWSDIQKSPNSPGNPYWVENLCRHLSPEYLVDAVMPRLWLNPLAKRHIDWYLNGSGADYIEDAALKIVLENDRGVRGAIGRRLPSTRPTGVYRDWFTLEQKHYELDDAGTAWGAIDRLDFEADYDTGTLHVWFKDRYEWHPYYPGLYTALAGDFARETNCVHAACVEMKSQGAADFWMVGEATVELRLVDGFDGVGYRNSKSWW